MTHPVDEFVGARIREERLRAGLSQGVLASNIGVKFQQVQKYETGKNRVSCSRLWEIAKALDLSTQELLPAEGIISKTDAHSIEPRLISIEEVAYIRKFVNLGEKERKIVMSLICMLKDD